MKPCLRCLIAVGILLVLAGVAPASAAPADRIPAGFDYWQTLGSGATSYNFRSDPIPAGFFCRGSAIFRGEVNFEGVPLTTEPARILGTTDTVIERLDEAVFDTRGIAKTRIRGRALNLTGTNAVKTNCGTWKVAARLADDQPVTEMVFRREHEHGGVFKADLRLRVEVTFTHQKTGATRSLNRLVSLPTVDDVPYAVGKATRACFSTTPIDPSPIDPTPIEPGPIGPGTLNSTFMSPSEQVTILDGRSSKREVPNVIRFKTTSTTPVATGCQCNPQGQCLPVYAWHDPCATNPNCEQHWTHTPCQLGYLGQCPPATADSYNEQLKVLRQRGIINAEPAEVLSRQLRPVENN